MDCHALVPRGAASGAGLTSAATGRRRAAQPRRQPGLEPHGGASPSCCLPAAAVSGRGIQKVRTFLQFLCMLCLC